MKKRNLLFCLFIFLIPPSFVVGAESPAPAKPAWALRWEKARSLAGQGSYREAEKLYGALLELPGLGPEKSLVRKEYEALRMKILFSPLETPDSFLYTIAPGDTLHELAQQHGTTVELLQKANGISGDRIYSGKKLKVTRSKFSVVVEKQRNRLILLADGRPFKRYRVATGEKGSTPAGTFKILNKLENPTWFHAGEAVSPEDPKNILGSRWMGFDAPGYGIHGTTLPETIGRQASKGCIRMLDSDVEEIYSLLPVGTTVTVKE